MRTLILLFLLTTQLSAQEIITGSYDFQTDPNKEYALYIPSAYDASIPSKTIIGLHPWNTNKWNAESWAEELSEIAEANNCIVICPDGGIDGQIDDDIDTAFTSFLIDEMILKYNIDENQMYAVGFSWGGKTVYTYGLNHIDRFAGFMVIGAAVTLDEVSPFSSNAKNKPYYIIHGSLDSPTVRFYPLVQELIAKEACVETNLLVGVAHTVEFPEQFNILNTGFQWLLEQNCGVVDVINQTEITIHLKNNLLSTGQSLIIETSEKINWEIYSVDSFMQLKGENSIISIDLTSGSYFIKINNQPAIKFVVL